MFRPLAERKTQAADTLSGGERQMLAVGRALMSRPKLLLLDEPSLGLAPRITAQIMATLRRLRDEQRLTVVLVEQNARSALSVADTAVVLNLGTVVAEGNAAELAGDDKLRHAYLGF
jgi:branched-chain amino acid transport system ATP-binding protein